MKIVSTNLSNFTSEIDKLDFHELVSVLVDLSKLTDVVKNDVVKKEVYNIKIIDPQNKSKDKETNFNEKNIICKTQLIAVSIYCYPIKYQPK